MIVEATLRRAGFLEGAESLDQDGQVVEIGRQTPHLFTMNYVLGQPEYGRDN